MGSQILFAYCYLSYSVYTLGIIWETPTTDLGSCSSVNKCLQSSSKFWLKWLWKCEVLKSISRFGCCEKDWNRRSWILVLRNYWKQNLKENGYMLNCNHEKFYIFKERQILWYWHNMSGFFSSLPSQTTQFSGRDSEKFTLIFYLKFA